MTVGAGRRADSRRRKKNWAPDAFDVSVSDGREIQGDVIAHQRRGADLALRGCLDSEAAEPTRTAALMGPGFRC